MKFMPKYGHFVFGSQISKFMFNRDVIYIRVEEITSNKSITKISVSGMTR